MIYHLTYDQVVEINAEVRGATDATERDLVIADNKGSIHYAVNLSRQGFYPSVEEVAIAMAYSITSGHAFSDGNKRTGYLSMKIYLELHGYTIDYSIDEAEATFLSVANGTMDRDEFRKTVINWIVESPPDSG